MGAGSSRWSGVRSGEMAKKAHAKAVVQNVGATCAAGRRRWQLEARVISGGEDEGFGGTVGRGRWLCMGGGMAKPWS